MQKLLIWHPVWLFWANFLMIGPFYDLNRRIRGNFGHPKSKPRVNYELFPEPKLAFKAPLRGSE